MQASEFLFSFKMITSVPFMQEYIQVWNGGWEGSETDTLAPGVLCQHFKLAYYFGA